MSIKRDDFPATSIGRTAGNRLQSNPSDAHPLLSPRPASPAPSDHGSIQAGASLKSSSSVHTTRYVPYTPRQRATPAAATTGTTVHQASSPQQSGDATSKLQLMHLKAAAQTMGLDSASLGWTMLEKLVSDAEAGDEWMEVWNVITSGKATLLLPLEASSTNERITPEFMKDHIVLCDGLSRNNAPMVTLSGLRGTLDDETLTFRSTINPTSKLFQDLLTLSNRTSGLSRLPPLPSPFPNIPPISYPKYQLTTHTPSLQIPPRSQSSNTKPALPPRPGIRAVQPISTPRISNPFASLFSKPTPQPPLPPPSPPTSLRSFDIQNEPSAHFDVSAFAIDRRITRRDLAKETNKALRSELKAAVLKSKTQPGILPPWMTERIHDLTSGWYPFVNARIKGTRKKKKKKNDHEEDEDDDLVDPSNRDTTVEHHVVVNSIDENLERLSERLQDFFASLERDLRLARDSNKVGKGLDVENGTDKEEMEMEMETEAKIRETMEAVERLVTWLFYDRLFSQPTTDDASHDEALSNRIAALNMLDLGLEHLGIDIGEVNGLELDAVVKACGEMLSRLDTCRCPADKAALLVAAHKIVVDGLGRLPPVRLISEDEAKSDGEVPLTAKPKLSSATSNTLETETETNTDLDVEPPAVTGSPSNPPEPISQPTAGGGDPSSPTSHAITEPKLKPIPPPLDLENNNNLKLPMPLTGVPKEPTPVSGDVLFPLIIFSVVKANPAHLVSNLLFTQRFRNQSVGGEESYCLINMMAVAEFLENVDMAALGLDNTDKVLSTADLTPILSSRTAETPSPTSTHLPQHAVVLVGGPSLRGRVEQQVDAITDSANKVISGVVDSSFGILRSFMPAATATGARSATLSGGGSGRMGLTHGQGKTQGLGLLRKDSGFSIASLAAALPIAGRSRLSGAGSGGGEEAGQQMMSVSRSGSRMSPKITVKDESEGEEEGEGEEEEGETESSEEESEEEDEESKVENEGGEPNKALSGDARSIRSFESMLSASRGRKGQQRQQQQQQPRKTLSDRLASMSATLNAKSSPSSRRSSLHVSHQRSRSGSPVGTAPETSSYGFSTPEPLPTALKLGPPNQRFMECAADDLRLSEVGELLREYRRLADGVRAAGGFVE